MSEVTRLLQQMGQGDRDAGAALLPLVYDELRRLARARMAHERAGHTLDATALVHEAYLRLLNDGDGTLRFETRGHFFATAAEAMRRILVEHARRKHSLKRGGGLTKPATRSVRPSLGRLGRPVRENQHLFLRKTRVFVCGKANQNAPHPYD